MFLIFALGSVLDIMISEDHVIQYIIPVANEYQEIHPCSAVNIDSVKINTSLIMMRECRTSISVRGHIRRLCRRCLYVVSEGRGVYGLKGQGCCNCQTGGC